MTTPAPTVAPGSFLTLHYRLAGPDGDDLVNTFTDKPATLSLGSGELSPALEARLLGLAERPLLLTHGWPGSHYEFWASIEKLAFPSRFGGDPAEILGGLSASGWHTSSLFMRMMIDAYLLSTASEGAPGIVVVQPAAATVRTARPAPAVGFPGAPTGQGWRSPLPGRCARLGKARPQW